MKKYEIMYIVNASLDDAAFKTVSDRLHATITENGGSIDKVDVTANNAGVFEFQRLSRISNNVIRVMVVKTEGEK